MCPPHGCRYQTIFIQIHFKYDRTIQIILPLSAISTTSELSKGYNFCVAVKKTFFAFEKGLS